MWLIWPGTTKYCIDQARIQEFRQGGGGGGGFQLPKDFDKQKKGHKGGGRGLHYLFCIGMVETAFSDKIWPTWYLPNTETHLT